ncbi:hypothetical protein F5X68DRAFT_235462 [Plectosphaerella plurivora]|uniref:BZIP domain-containing protein n=1 Tax=Plectosphaerella plurivora TaxID=936078 RepID=A0A9P8V4P9_9PEZI|nr:hypothetical protein F5X68DRAFT_235462 [Plectosphaerella plurivora]
MDTPNFFGDAAASLEASMVGDNSFVLDPSTTAGPLPQFDLNPGAFVQGAPHQANPWDATTHMVTASGPPPMLFDDEDVKPMPRRSAATTTIPPPPKASVSMSSSLTDSKSSRASSDGSARSRKSLSSQSTAPDEPEPTPNKGKSKSKTKTKQNKKSTRELTPEPIEEEPAEDGKRSKFLERNRVAASKCRQRKKQWMSGLQDTKNELEARHHQLQLEHSSLVNEVSSMKNQLMSHANCNDPNINLWIDNEARRFVQSEAGRVSISQVMQGHVAPGMPQMPMRPSFDERASSASPLALDPSMANIQPKIEAADEINYDHMPDSIFQQDIQDLAG